ncbi:site-specific DNA-methyltransferase [Sphingobacterium sp.]|uniref:site-specific DNA-methyltransferase n=1 Tax=Sphingobacterium sp. TaxID=341027 RepID=UPI00289D437F|nr:site-specific DNA-methyltransferase [Sphingobacterium sp.]
MNTEQDITHNIQAINPNLYKLKQAFPNCFDKNGDFDFAKFKAELNTSDLNIAKEGYSLDWLGKSYARVLASDAVTTLLKEDEAHNAKLENANSQNLLIKGDNLEVLKHLSNAYYEKVKMIYIDPPYNTGSDGFVYNDDRKFTAKQLQKLAGVGEDEAKRILEFTQSNSNSHSAWLTFMYPRLYIAKQFLKDDGVIFVSIDDNEVAQLRLLMDEVFGEENFVEKLIWKRRATAPNDRTIGRNHEYIVVYAKTLNMLDMHLLSRDEKSLSRYSNPDNDPRGPWTPSDLSANGKGGRFTQTCVYEIINKDTGEKYYPPKNKSWLYNKEKMDLLIREGRIGFRNSSGAPFLKRYLEEVRQGVTLPTIMENSGFSQDSARELKLLFNNDVFDFPKPTKLLKTLLKISTSDSDYILDFFAGSGTIAQSVMQLNLEDGGNRKYILAQLPEAIDVKKSKIAYDFVKDELGITPPTIFEITKERIIRAANKIREDNVDKPSKSIKIKCDGIHDEHCPACNGEYIIKTEASKARDLSNQDFGFKVFETIPIWEDYDFKAEKLANAEKLFDDEKLTEEDVKALFTTWKTYDGSQLTESVEEIDLVGYKAYYTKQKLYLMHKGFSTDTLKALLEQIDADVTLNPTAIIAFGYYFESKALREIGENIKTYNNKKNIDIDFITRY